MNKKIINIEQAIEDDYSIRKQTGIGISDDTGAKTLEKNVDKLDTVHYDMEFDIDPLFKKTSAKFDEGGAVSLLVNTLSVFFLNDCI